MKRDLTVLVAACMSFLFFACNNGPEIPDLDDYESEWIGTLKAVPSGSFQRDQNAGNNKRLPNELGLHDMSGNVYEWCWDFYGEIPQGSLTDLLVLITARAFFCLAIGMWILGSV